MSNPFPNPNAPNLFDGSYNKLYGPYKQPFKGYDTTDIQPDTQELAFSMFGKPGYYQYIGQADGFQGIGPHTVQLGDEQYQPDYDMGWAAGNYQRTMAGVNNVSL